jgi:hypothetical protein
VADCFGVNGKDWSIETKDELKHAVAKAVARSPATALNRHKEEVFDALVRSLEERLTEREMARKEVASTD